MKAATETRLTTDYSPTICNVFYSTEYSKNLDAINTPSSYHECIKDGKSTIFSTAPPSVIRRPETVFEIYPFGHQYVANRLNQRQLGNLLKNPLHPVFIDAQTGCGKTHMIFHELFPILKEKKQHLLIIASRSALKQQVKYDAIRADAPELFEELTDTGIRKRHHFGDIDVYSYQDFNNPVCFQEVRKKLRSQSYGYGAIVFDECHYFVADADFNLYTESQFNLLLDKAIRSQVFRIYLTATPDSIFDRIYQKECDCNLHMNGYRERYMNSSLVFQHYYFRRDYGYLNVRFFYKKDLTSIIAKNYEKKVLVFTESKEWAKEKMADLKEQGMESAFLLDTTSSHDENSELSGEVREGLLHNELSVQVLFATKCLDAGVTINTKELTIICYLKDKVDFIQAIGRKRIKGEEKVNLYIPIYTEADIDRQIGQIKRKQADMKKALEDFPDGALMNGDSYPPFPVYVKDGKYHHNGFALKKTDAQLREFQSLKQKISLHGKDSEITIARHMLSWLGLEDDFSTDMMIGYLDSDSKEKSERNLILQIIHKYEGQEFGQGRFQELQQKLKPFDTRVDQREGREVSTQTMNAICKKHNLPYRIAERNGTFRITRKDDEND